MRQSVIHREEVDDGQLAQFFTSDFEYRFTATFPILASVDDNVGPDTLGAEFLLVVSQQFDGLVVVKRALVVPHGGIDARERDVLIGRLTQQTQESHLNDTDRFVCDFGGASHFRVPNRFGAGLAPRNVGHLGRLDIGEDARFSRSRHVAVHVNGIIGHSQIGIDPVPSVFELWVTEVEVFAGANGIFFGSLGFLDAFQVLSHGVDGTVHVQ